MKIKTVKKLNLHELIEYVWEDDVRGKSFKSNLGTEVIISSKNRKVFMNHYVGIDDIFTVEVEEELTEDTEIHGPTFVYYDELSQEVKTFIYADETYPSLKQILRPHSCTISLAVFRGKQLIWTKEHGISESGVLEVVAE